MTRLQVEVPSWVTDSFMQSISIRCHEIGLMQEQQEPKILHKDWTLTVGVFRHNESPKFNHEVSSDKNFYKSFLLRDEGLRELVLASHG